MKQTASYMALTNHRISESYHVKDIMKIEKKEVVTMAASFFKYS